jgi:hypothetical protein
LYKPPGGAFVHSAISFVRLYTTPYFYGQRTFHPDKISKNRQKSTVALILQQYFSKRNIEPGSRHMRKTAKHEGKEAACAMISGEIADDKCRGMHRIK